MLTDSSTWQNIAGCLRVPLTVVDIGARGGVEDRWSRLVPHVKIYGFEPDEDECARLNEEDRDATYIPVALGANNGDRRFYVTADPFCSSLYPSNEEIIREHPRLEAMIVKQVTQVKTRTIDDWVEDADLDRVDFFKIDAQGAELAILDGASHALRDVRSLDLEVQFSQLYRDTPLFGDVDSFLRARGFVLWRLGELSHCGFREGSSGIEIPEMFNYDTDCVDWLSGGGQLLWANAHYVRQEVARASQEVAWEDAVRDACIAHVYRYDDLAEMSLKRAVEHAQSDAQEVIRTALAGVSRVAETRGLQHPARQEILDELKQIADERLALIDEQRTAADKRLELIGELKQAADDRLVLINELHGIAAEQRQALKSAADQLAAREAELQELRRRR